MCLTQTLLALGAFVADQNDFRFFVRMEIADNIRSPISVANHTNPDHKAPWDYKRHAGLACASGARRSLASPARGNLAVRSAVTLASSFFPCSFNEFSGKL